MTSTREVPQRPAAAYAPIWSGMGGKWMNRPWVETGERVIVCGIDGVHTTWDVETHQLPKFLRVCAKSRLRLVSRHEIVRL